MKVDRRLQNVYQSLLNHFGPQGWWPLYSKETGSIEYHKNDYSFPKNEKQSFEISVGAILTQNTSWKNVEKALHHLHQRQLLTPEPIRNLSIHALALIIKSSGYHTQKAKKLHAFVDFLQSGKTMIREHLLDVWGIGQETADSILLYAYRQPTFVIDAYTQRIFERLGFGKKDYGQRQQSFLQHLPNEVALFQEYHALLVALGKDFCKKNKPLCEKCPLRKECNYFLQRTSAADCES